MPFFKFYRPNVYFEKAIRYNEIYFCENNELNDPNDLKVSYYFEDDVCLWQKLLSLKPSIKTWDLGFFLDVADVSLALKLNDLFKGVKFDSAEGSIRHEVENQSQQLAEIFRASIRPERADTPPADLSKEASLDHKIQWCKLSLTALLTRAVDHKFYSVSFSKSALEPMMWAHYADGFKGCVVIYDDFNQRAIELRHNLSSKNRMMYEFFEVGYIDEEKKVPIIECAIGGQAKAQAALLKKTPFGNMRMSTGC